MLALLFRIDSLLKRFQEYPDKRRGMKRGEGRYVVHSEKEN